MIYGQSETPLPDRWAKWAGGCTCINQRLHHEDIQTQLVVIRALEEIGADAASSVKSLLCCWMAVS